jgi:tripartite-type tricarboxylate transporter receptor subunit TctC
MIAWYNTFAPGRTPDAITRKLNAEFNRILQLPDVREKLSGQGVTAMIGTPADLSKYLDFEVERWAKVIKEAGIKLN